MGCPVLLRITGLVIGPGSQGELGKKTFNRTNTGGCSACDCFTLCLIPYDTAPMMQEVWRVCIL